MSRLVIGTKEDGHRRRWTPEATWLPEWCKRRLDAEGRVRGATWREMPADSGHEDVKAMNWFFWKRGLLLRRVKHLNRAERAKNDALMAMAAEEAAEAKA